MSSVKGKVKVIQDLETFASGFSKQGIVITTDEKYPQDIKLDFVKDKTAMLDSLSIGDDVEISYNLRGNEYKGKYYVNLEGWKIDSSAGAAKAGEPRFDPPYDSDRIGASNDDEPPF